MVKWRASTPAAWAFLPKKQSTGRPLESGVDRTEDRLPGIPSRIYVRARPERLLVVIS